MSTNKKSQEDSQIFGSGLMLGGQRWVHYQGSFAAVAVGSVDIAPSRGLNRKIIAVCGAISNRV